MQWWPFHDSIPYNWYAGQVSTLMNISGQLLNKLKQDLYSILGLQSKDILNLQKKYSIGINMSLYLNYITISWTNSIFELFWSHSFQGQIIAEDSTLRNSDPHELKASGRCPSRRKVATTNDLEKHRKNLSKNGGESKEFRCPKAGTCWRISIGLKNPFYIILLKWISEPKSNFQKHQELVDWIFLISSTTKTKNTVTTTYEKFWWGLPDHLKIARCCAT